MSVNPFETIDSRLNAIESLLAEIKQELPGSGTPQKNDLTDILGAMEETCLSKARLYYLVHKGMIPNIKKGGKLYFRRSELRAWIQEGARKPKGGQV